jgi:hypothetical protein
MPEDAVNKTRSSPDQALQTPAPGHRIKSRP